MKRVISRKQRGKFMKWKRYGYRNDGIYVSYDNLRDICLWLREMGIYMNFRGSCGRVIWGINHHDRDGGCGWYNGVIVWYNRVRICWIVLFLLYPCKNLQMGRGMFVLYLLTQGTAGGNRAHKQRTQGMRTCPTPWKYPRDRLPYCPVAAYVVFRTPPHPLSGRSV